jgi:perosamine synthetase
VGDIGVFSLNIHKHIQAGEGGMCVTADPVLAKRLQLIRNHGENAVEWLDAGDDLTNLIGFNFRLPELSAAIGAAQLQRLDALVTRAEDIGRRLSRGIAGSARPGRAARSAPAAATPTSCGRSGTTPTVVGASRGEPSAAPLVAEGVPATEGYVRPLHLLPHVPAPDRPGPRGLSLHPPSPTSTTGPDAARWPRTATPGR